MAKNYNLTNQEIKDTFDQLAQVSGSIEGGVSGYAVVDGTGSKVSHLNVTASYALTASLLTGTVVSASYAVSASHVPDTVVTSSAAGSTITFTKANGTTYTNTITTATALTASFVTSSGVHGPYGANSIESASHAVSSNTSLDANDLVVQVKNVSGDTINKGQVLHATGVTGENINVVLADNTNAANMPGFAIANQTINNDAAGQAIISGKIINIDTSGLTAGSNVYVNATGGFTGTKPTGSALIQNIGVVGKVNATEGELVVLGAGRSNDVPNISPGYLWVGNSDSVATAVTTSSLLVDSASFATNSTSASHALNADNSINADTASYVNTLNQDVIISGSSVKIYSTDPVASGSLDLYGNITLSAPSSSATLRINGNNSRDGIYVEGGSITINRKGDRQFGSYAVYYDSEQYPGSNYNAFQIINAATGSNKFTANSEVTSFSGLDGSNPVYRLRAGGNNGTDGNTILWSSYDKPYAHFTKQSVFDQAITASAVISASGGVTGDVTGTLNGNVNATSGTSTFQDITVNGTGSFNYIQSITGSAKVIGDAFLVLNNDLPAERYAGIKVLDTGSTTNSASLVWDGQTNDWFYEFSSSGTHEYGVVMMGPEYTTQGSPTYLTSNTIPKGNGGHHLEDTNITDDGSTVKINSNTQITGSLNASGLVQVDSNNIKVLNSNNSAVAVGDATNPQQFAQMRIYNNIDTYDGSLYNAFNLIDEGSATDGWSAGMEVTTFASAYDGNNKVFRIGGGGLTGPNGAYTNNQYILTATTTGGKVYMHKDTEFESNVKFDQALTASAQISASAGIIVGEITGSVDVAGGVTANAGNVTVYNSNNSAVAVGDASNPQQFSQIRIYNNIDTYDGNLYNAFNFIDGGTAVDAWSAGMEVGTYSGVDGSNKVFRISGGSSSGSLGNYSTGNYILAADTTKGKVYQYKDTEFKSPVIHSSSVSFEVDGLTISSQTASIDVRQGNYFTLGLVSGSDTHIDATNLLPGQTYILKTLQPSTAADSHGTISFAPEFKFAGGTAPTATAASGSTDIYTFVSFDSSNVFSTAVSDLK